jgi:glutamine synthetase
VGTAGQAEIDMRFDTLLRTADKLMLYKYIVKNVAWQAGKTVTFMPKPIFGGQRLGHAHPPVAVEGRRAAVLRRDRLRRLSDMARWYIGGLLKHAPALLAFTAPTTNSYKRLVPGLRGAGQPGVLAAQPLGGVPHPALLEEPAAKRVEFRCPDPSATRTWPSRRC